MTHVEKGFMRIAVGHESLDPEKRFPHMQVLSCWGRGPYSLTRM